MKTITALELRNDLEGVVRALKRGERMTLTYRGETVGEIAPAKPAQEDALPEANRRALKALQAAWAITAEDPDYRRKAEAFKAEMRAWREDFGPEGEPADVR